MAKRKSTDYVARRRNKDSDESEQGNRALSVRWWKSETGADAQGKLWTWIERLRSQWAMDGIGDLIHEAIYADEPLARGGTFDGQRWNAGAGSGTTPLNVIMSLVDTATARLTKTRSMPCVSADDASYSEKRFARKSSRVLRRKMGSQDVETAAPLTIRDFVIRGTSATKVDRVFGDTTTERVPIFEIVYDHREAQFARKISQLSQIAHVRPESRDTMIARYPKFKAQIEAVAPFTRMDPWMQFVYQGPSLADLIEVAESWHPPSKPDADDGQHIVCIRGTTVCREPWFSCWPVEFCHWTPPTRGLRGKGIVAEQSAAQDMVNEILSDARDGLKHGSQLKVFVPRNSNINKHHLRSRHPAVIEHDGAEPHYVAANPVSEQAWRMAFQVKDEMYNLSGISQWAAQGKPALGKEASGKALETVDDNQSDRFAHVETGYQQSRVGIGRCHIESARWLAMDAAGDIEQRFEEQPERTKKEDLAEWITKIDWRKVEIDKGTYRLTLEPINFIAGTRGGKLEEAAEAAKAGLIPDPSMTAALFEEPDMARMNRPVLGPYHRLEKIMDGLAEPSVPYINLQPDRFMNHALGILMAKGELGEAEAEEADEEIIQRFRDWILDCEKVQKEMSNDAAPSLPGAMPNTQVAQPNAATLQPGLGGPPMGAPPMGMPPGGGAGSMPPGAM